jgi:signal transduction histidine kinase
LKQTTLLVQRSLQAEAASLWLVDETDQELVLIASSGIGSDTVTGYRLPVHKGIVGHVTQTGEPYISADVSRDKLYFRDVARMSNYTPRSLLSVPVQVKGQIVGVMQALHQKVNWFDRDDLRLSYLVVSSVGIAVENARLFSEVQDFNRHLEQMVSMRTKQLAEEKEKTEAILASMADGLLVLDAQNCILTANTVAERMLDFDLSDLQGQPIGPERLKNPLWRCVSDMVGSGEQTVSASVDVPTPQMEAILSIQAHSAEVRNEADQVIGTVIVLRDITALKEIERIKARFMAGVTHELKTPLSVIQLHSKNLLTYYKRLPEQKRFELIRSIQAQSELLGQFIEDILALSRLDVGVTQANRKLLNLAELIDQTVKDLAPMAEEKQIILNWKKPATALTVLADSSQLKRVARNLIDNAIKYTPAGGSVNIHTLSESIDGRTFATIRVTDTGIGIPPEHQSRVFERFHRVDSSHTVPGTGLGLSIVKEIANAHGGSVKLESAPGMGSTFVVLLPGGSRIS